jgi:DNA invertase Pin-like site-specific DNA recombinase
MIIGVARTSTLEQVAGLEAQVRQLEEYGCERVYQEQVSSVGERVKLEEALGSLRQGDKLVVTNWIVWHVLFSTLVRSLIG